MKRLVLIALLCLLNSVSVTADEFSDTRTLAEQGDASAQFNLGVAHLDGEGVPQDYVEAVKWFRKAANQGHADAQYNLGVMYERGVGVPQDSAEAYVWFNLAASNGDESDAWFRDEAAGLLSPEELSVAQKRSAQLFEEINKRKQE